MLPPRNNSAAEDVEEKAEYADDGVWAPKSDDLSLRSGTALEEFNSLVYMPWSLLITTFTQQLLEGHGDFFGSFIITTDADIRGAEEEEGAHSEKPTPALFHRQKLWTVTHGCCSYFLRHRFSWAAARRSVSERL